MQCFYFRKVIKLTNPLVIPLLHSRTSVLTCEPTLGKRYLPTPCKTFNSRLTCCSLGLGLLLLSLLLDVSSSIMASSSKSELVEDENSLLSLSLYKENKKYV